MPTIHLERLKTGIPPLDSYINYLCTEIELACNVTASPPLQARRVPSGLQLAMSSSMVRMAKSGGSGIPAATPTAMGKATVTVYDIDPATGNYASQTITDDGYNLSTTAVGNNKMLLQVKVNNLWITFWEDCT